MTASTGLTAVSLTDPQRDRWQRHRDTGSAIARALRISGDVDDTRLAAAAREVADAFEFLRLGLKDGTDGPVPVLAEPVWIRHGRSTPARCLADLLAERERRIDPATGPLCRMSVSRIADGDLVLGVVADPLLLDLRSVYLLLGAVMQAYFGRFRPGEYQSYVEVAETLNAGAVPAGRLAWWSRRLDAWSAQVRPATETAAEPFTIRLPFDQWSRLCRIGDSVGNNSSLAVVALLAWWLRFRDGRPGPARFTSDLDLREYHGLGAVIGPLTDRIPFEVAADPGMSFHDLVRRCHIGLLDSVVRYVPFDRLHRLGNWPGGEVAVHYCRTPPLSSATRGEAELARLGLSVELFREADLATPDGGAPGTLIALDIAEAGDGIALLAQADRACIPPRRLEALRHDLALAIDQVAADPLTPIGRL